MHLLKRFLRPPFYIGAGVLGAGGTLYLLTRVLGLSLMLALLVVLTIVLVVVIGMLVRQLRAARASEEIEKTISRQADRDIEKSVPGKVAEMQNMKAELLAAIEALKSSKLGKSRGQAALSLLPWYMLVGPAGAGKSTLVTHSGLHFPLLDEDRNPKAVKGVGGTRSFQWWLTEEAVILDMAGRMLGTAAFEDTEAWVDFLQVLRGQRKQKPLNGVLVAVSVDQVAGRSEAQLDQLARSVRERVQELVHHLGVVFPVYVIFTQCDRLAGFAEFFGDLPRGEYRQVWGATFPADVGREEEAATLFDTEFALLQAALSDRRMARLAAITDPVQRARAFAFPLQLERVRGGMRRFLQSLFEPDPVEESPLFRGFYLTSARQEGTPVDRVLAPIAAEVGAAPAAAQVPFATGDAAFFTHDLLTEVVFPDASLATTSSRAEAQRRRLRVTLFAGLGVAFLTIAILLGVLSAANGHLMGRTRRAAQEVARQVRPDAPFMENLATLEELRSRVETVDSLSRRKPLWRWLGGYAGDVLRDPALQLYVEKSLETLVAPSVHEMEASLARLTDSKQGEFIRYYYMFRAWRLLSEPKQIQPEDASILAREMGNALNPRIAYASPADRERFPALMRKQVEFLAAHADWVARLAPAYYRLGNPDLVARAADRVRSTWDSSQFYRLMIDEVRPLAAPATLESLAGGGGGLLNGTYEVPGAYTKEGWEQQIKPRVEWYRVQMQRDWVVADAFRPKPAPDLAHDILALYARDYSGQWVSFLNSLNVANPRDLAGAAEMLKSAAQDDSPILKVLRAVSEQTELGADPRSELGQVQNDFEIVHDFFQAPESAGGAKRVTSFFARFFQKPKVGPGGNVLDRNQAPSDLYKAQLKAAAENVLSAAQPGAAASEIRKLMAVGDESTNPLKQVMAWAEGLAASYSGGAAAQPTMRLLQLPITGAREAARGGMRPELNSKWNLLVVTPFQKTLAGRYPMVAEGADAALFDFAEFFRPGGTFWSFYEAELKEYVLEDGTPRDPESASGLSPQLIECLRKAHDIREAFFSTDPNAPKLRFSVRAKPPSIEGPAVVRWVSFDVGGQFATYSMGVQQWMPLEWPGTDQGAGAAVRAQAKDGPQPEGINATGPWGLFHVLDRGQLGQTGGNPSVTWRLAAGQSRILVSYEIQPSSARHPFLDGFLRFSLPASL